MNKQFQFNLDPRDTPHDHYNRNRYRVKSLKKVIKNKDNKLSKKNETIIFLEDQIKAFRYIEREYQHLLNESYNKKLKWKIVFLKWKN